MIRRRTKKVLVIVHDAGGAEIIGAYINKYQKNFDFHCYTAGPAQKIFRRRKISSATIAANKDKIAQIVHKHSDATFALIGTGWMTTIESDALMFAKSLGIKTVVYLEAWWNYRERFGYPNKHWKEHLPDELWVGDKYAEVIVKKQFPTSVIKYVPNQYFAAIKADYKALKKILVKQKKNILFLSDCTEESYAALQYLLSVLSEKKSQEHLRIRFHPADDKARYDELIAKYKRNVKIEKSSQKDITRDLLHAKLVIGTETVAMAVSVVVGIKTMSIKKTKQPFLLPFKQIIQVHNIKALRSLI